MSSQLSRLSFQLPIWFTLSTILLLSRAVESSVLKAAVKTDIPTYDLAVESVSVKTDSESNDVPPIFIAHRGDKFLMPENTIPAYDLALLTNVDYVEPDLVLTKDGVLVCHHDIQLGEGTDVASHPEFADMATYNKTMFIDGRNVTINNDWLVSNFTYDQLSTLRVHQKKTGWRPQYFNGFYRIPTFKEYLHTIHRHTWRRQTETSKTGEVGAENVIGINPELKYTNYHNDMFHTEHYIEDKFLTELAAGGYLDNNCTYNGTTIPCSPILVQCLQMDTIFYLRNKTDLKLMALLEAETLRYLTYSGLKELANHTDYIGVWKEMLYTGTELESNYQNFSYDKKEIEQLGGFVGPQDLVPYAHSLGLKVGIFTIYHSEEESYRGCAVKCETKVSKEEELNYYLNMGVDAFFVEGLSESLRIRDAWLENRNKTLTSHNGVVKDGTRKARSSLLIMIRNDLDLA